MPLAVLPGDPRYSGAVYALALALSTAVLHVAFRTRSVQPRFHISIIKPLHVGHPERGAAHIRTLVSYCAFQLIIYSDQVHGK